MPIQKESQAAGMPPMINLGLSAEDARPTPIMRNACCVEAERRRKPNLPHHRLAARPKKAKRTQFATQPPASRPKNAKRTQSTDRQHPKKRNEPNFRCSEQILTTNDWRLKTAFNKTNPIYPYGHGMPCPYLTKRTQSTVPTPQMRKTNPIYPTRHHPVGFTVSKKYETNPISTHTLPFLLSPLYFLLSRGQQPAPPNLPNRPRTAGISPAKYGGLRAKC